MDSRRVKDLMVSLDQYPVVPEGATLHEAVLALEQAQKNLPPGRQPYRAVLIVDDKIRVCESLGQNFEQLGYTCQFATNGSEAIGKQVVEHIGSSKAVLLKQHGVFTIGETATAAVKAAVMVEDVAKAVWLALQIGEVMDIDQEAIEKLHDRYTHVYGQ